MIIFVILGSNVGSLYGSEVSYKDTETAIILPRSLLLSKRTQSNKPTRISFSLYRTTQLFTPALKSNTTNQSENVTISHVISASIKGREIKGLKTPVKIIFKPQQVNFIFGYQYLIVCSGDPYHILLFQ